MTLRRANAFALADAALVFAASFFLAVLCLRVCYNFFLMFNLACLTFLLATSTLFLCALHSSEAFLASALAFFN